MEFSENRSAISKPSYSPSRASFNSAAAVALAWAGKSSLPRKNRRILLKTSGQKGIDGSGSPEARALFERNLCRKRYGVPRGDYGILRRRPERPVALCAETPYPLSDTRSWNAFAHLIDDPRAVAVGYHSRKGHPLLFVPQASHPSVGKIHLYLLQLCLCLVP